MIFWVVLELWRGQRSKINSQVSHPPCKKEDRQTDLCNVIFIVCVPKSEICRQSPSAFFQCEAHVTGFTGGFFIEEPDRPWIIKYGGVFCDHLCFCWNLMEVFTSLDLKLKRRLLLSKQLMEFTPQTDVKLDAGWLKDKVSFRSTLFVGFELLQQQKTEKNTCVCEIKSCWWM